MRRLVSKTKKALTLVELVVAITLTAMFATACVMLILPVSTIYKRNNDLARAQLLADTVADCIRVECTRNQIEHRGDVWITNEAAVIYSEESTSLQMVSEGSVLVIRKTPDYCETIASNYQITGELYNNVWNADKSSSDDPEYVPLTGGVSTSRSVYRFFPSPNPGVADVASDKGRVHFGYFGAGITTSEDVYPQDFYDFTDPVSNATYREYTVDLSFSNLRYNVKTDLPSSVDCTIIVLQDGRIVYERTVSLFLS